MEEAFDSLGIIIVDDLDYPKLVRMLSSHLPGEALIHLVNQVIVVWTEVRILIALVKETTRRLSRRNGTERY